MKILKKNVVLMSLFLCLMALANVVQAGSLFEKKGTSKAQEYIDMDKFPEADSCLEGWIHDNPKDFDAYWMHANLLMKPGYRRYSRAYTQFGYALKLKSGKQREVEEKFKNAFREEIARNDVSQARDLGKMVINLNPSYKQQVYNAFYAKGKTSSGQAAVSNFEAAFEFASNQAEYEKIGKNFLKIALDNPQFGYLVNRATSILGKGFVDDVMPSQMSKVIFSQTYTDADLGANGKVDILDYSQNPIHVGDVIIVQTIMPDDADNVQVSVGNGWLKIPVGGKYKLTTTNAPSSGHKTVIFTKGQGVKVQVELIRTITKNTNFSRLTGL